MSGLSFFIRQYSLLWLVLAGLTACGDASETARDVESLKASLAAFDTQEKEIIAARKNIAEELKGISLKDPYRLEVVDRDMDCKKTLEKLQFTRRQYKRRIKAAKAGMPDQVMETPPVFRCD